VSSKVYFIVSIMHQCHRADEKALDGRDEWGRQTETKMERIWKENSSCKAHHWWPTEDHCSI